MNARDRFEELLLDYVEDALPAPDRSEFEALCAANPSWRSEAEAERGLVSMMKKVPRRRAPEGILAAALADARRAPVVEIAPTPAGDGETSGRRSRAWFAPFAAAAAILVVAGTAVLLPRDRMADRPSPRRAVTFAEEKAAKGIGADTLDRKSREAGAASLGKNEARSRMASVTPPQAESAEASTLSLNLPSPVSDAGAGNVLQEAPAAPAIAAAPVPAEREHDLATFYATSDSPASGLVDNLRSKDSAKEMVMKRSEGGDRFYFDPTNGTVSRGDIVRSQADPQAVALLQDSDPPAVGGKVDGTVAAISAPVDDESKKQLASLMSDLRSDSLYDASGYTVLADFPTRPAANSYAGLSEPPAAAKEDAASEEMRYLVIDVTGERSVIPYLVSAIRLPEELSADKDQGIPEGTRQLGLSSAKPKNLRQDPGRAAREIAARTIDSDDALTSALGFFGAQSATAKLKAETTAAAAGRSEPATSSILTYHFASIGDARKALASLLLMPAEKTPAIDARKAYVLSEGTGAILMIPRR